MKHSQIYIDRLTFKTSEKLIGIPACCAILLIDFIFDFQQRPAPGLLTRDAEKRCTLASWFMTIENPPQPFVSLSLTASRIEDRASEDLRKPERNMVGLASLSVAACVTVPAWLIVRSRQRLRQDGVWARETDSAILKPVNSAANETVQLESSLERCIGKSTTEERVKAIGELEDRLKQNKAFAERAKDMCCGRLQPLLASICEEAKSSLHETEPALARANSVRLRAERYENILEAFALSRALEEALPEHGLPWRAPWQSEDRSRDAELLLARARRRGEGKRLAPIADYVYDLDRLAKRSSLTIRALESTVAQDHDFARQKKKAITILAPHREFAAKALELLQESTALHEERSNSARLALAEKAAKAAEVSAREARRTRLALEAANADRRNCLRAINALTTALSRSETSSLPQLFVPSSLRDCRNDEDPISLDSIRSLPLTDLCKLPSGHCITISNLLAMPRDIDPVTNLPLPANFRQHFRRQQQQPTFANPNTSTHGGSTHLYRTEITKLIASARRACDYAASSSSSSRF